MPRTMVHAMWLLVLSTLFASPTLLLADGPKDNLTDNVRPIPPAGIKLTAANRVELEIGLVVLRKQLKQLRTRRDKRTAALLPDVEIFHRAVHDALKYREFFAPSDVNEAKQLLAEDQGSSCVPHNGGGGGPARKGGSTQFEAMTL